MSSSSESHGTHDANGRDNGPDDIAFRAWRDTFEPKHWSTKDLGACRLGWDAALAHERGQAPEYLIWSNQHRAWWRPEAAGYSVSIEGAGLYSRAEAMEIAATSRDGWSMGRVPDEIAVSLADIPAHIRAAVLALNGRV